MAVKGIFVSDAGALQERNDGLNSTILKEARGGTVPLFALSSGMSSSDCQSTVVTWYEEGIWSTRTAVTAAPQPLGAMLTVEDASWIHENMIFIAESTGEHMLVLGVTGNTLTVQRGLAGTERAPIVIGGDEFGIQCIGTAFEEASERPTGIASNPYPRTNITQIFRRAWDISRTAQSTTYRFGSRLERNKADAAMQHALDMEYAMIWGRRMQGVVNNKPYRQMDGLLAQMRSNIFISPAAGLTRRSLEDYVERLFSTNIKGQPNERISFCGNSAIRALNEIAWRYGQYNISVRENDFGINVQRFICPFGELTMMVHPLMNESPLWTQDIYSFHPGAMEICWLDRTFHQTEGTSKAAQGSASDLRDGTSGVFTSEMTVKYGMEATGAIMTGVLPDHYDMTNP